MWLWLVILAGLAAVSLWLGAPYVPTHKSALSTAIKLLALRRGQKLIELGVGDGRIALAAAQKGWRVEAYEINPVLWLAAYAKTWRYRRQVKLHLADFKSADWPKDAKAIYVFGNKFVMNYLARRLSRWPRPIRLVSYGFELPEHQPAKKAGGLWRYDIKPVS